MNLLKITFLFLSFVSMTSNNFAMDKSLSQYPFSMEAIKEVGVTASITFAVYGFLYYRTTRMQSWLDAATNPDLNITKQLLLKKSYLTEQDNHGRSPLHIASEMGQVEKIKLLLDHNAYLFALNNNGSSPISHAANFNQTESIRTLLQYPAFSARIKAFDTKSYSRIREAILVMNQNSKTLSKDVKNKILGYLPEDVLNVEHLKVIFNAGADIKELCKICPLEWFVDIYDQTQIKDRPAFLNKIVPAIAEYRLEKIRELLQTPSIKTLDPAHTNPIIIALVDENKIEQHRSAIEENVRKIFTLSTLQKYPNLLQINQITDYIH